MQKSGESPLPGWIRCALNSRLDGINRGVRHGSHSTRQPSQQEMLPTGQLRSVVLWLVLFSPFLECLVSCKVDCLIGSLSYSGESNTAIQSAESFFFDHSICSMCGVAVLGHIERIGHRVVLGL